MGFIIRSAFWLSLVLLLIPFGNGDDGKSVSPVQAMFAAKGAIEDLSGMCERKPDVCAVGSAAFHTIGVRAREGARMAYTALGGDQPAAATDAVADQIARAEAERILATGSVSPLNR